MLYMRIDRNHVLVQATDSIMLRENKSSPRDDIKQKVEELTGHKRQHEKVGLLTIL